MIVKDFHISQQFNLWFFLKALRGKLRLQRREKAGSDLFHGCSFRRIPIRGVVGEVQMVIIRRLLWGWTRSEKLSCFRPSRRLMMIVEFVNPVRRSCGIWKTIGGRRLLIVIGVIVIVISSTEQRLQDVWLISIESRSCWIHVESGRHGLAGYGAVAGAILRAKLRLI